MRLGGEVQSDVLLGNQAGAYSRAQVFVEELCHLVWADVFPRFEEATCEDGNGVGVRLDQIGHDTCELYLLLECLDLLRGIGQECGQGVDVVVVDLGHVWVGDYDEGQVAKRLDAMGESRW